MKRTGIIILIILIAAIVVIETGVRLVIDLPSKTDFYSSIAKKDIPAYQELYRIKTTSGPTWIHLGWIADPKTESYTVFIREDKT
ncbi:MAG: hypothetical protein JW920_11465, partial [Deltaproteobacteria bacterium]|nr:hypothetical protein [Deltaproteobacteria bacterium]